MRILVVDDDPLTRKFFEVSLPAPEFQVVTAANGLEAITAAKQTPFYMAFCDMIMPIMDGLDTLKSLLRVQPNLPVIMMTAYAVEDDLILALHLGAVDYIYKPFKNAADILNAMERYNKRQQLKPVTEHERKLLLESASPPPPVKPTS